ncbi:hypothetical protein J2Z76_002102 [Sedimentibacter acidaminivorans]|uniref:Type 4 fimbrial biogenesis protein PilX N-terminal domain-containing protein n=1 Tax=Sedimentibacter acidaminivorans TaxID=913099 RepID=A0ABS4GF18_9FIRM|nr:hypothetical protein [Sedimentibacter acidaminivorans]MBP1926237.1 hypothetical protein [Sedimentibacter acidaminivorans]
MFSVEENKSENRTYSSTPFGIGGTLIMVIFVSLCLTIFSTLSFTTAYSDLKLSIKTQEMVKDYYVAHGRAEEKLSQIYGKLLLSQSYLNTKVDNSISILENYNIIAKNKVLELEGIKVLESREEVKDFGFTVYYEALGNFNQKICVTLNIYYDKIKNKPYYEVVSWNLANIDLPSYEEDVYDLWEGID